MIGGGFHLPVSASDFGALEAKTKIKGPFGSRKPISFLFRTWALVLKIEVERSVRIELEWHPAADGKTVQAVSYLEALLVVECYRPESVHRRDSRLIEVNCLFVRAVERFARLVAQIERVNRILRQVRTES
jgi:hypothetical protein